VVFAIITGLMFLENLFGDAMKIIFFASTNAFFPIPLLIIMFLDLDVDVDLEMFFAVGIMMTIKSFVLCYWNLAAEGLILYYLKVVLFAGAGNMY